VKEIPHKDDYIIIEKSSNRSKSVFWIFFGILGFIAIYMPFYGANLRYQTGTMFSKTFNFIGTTLMVLGGLMLIWGLFSLFCGSTSGGIKLMILGVLLIIIASYFLAPATIVASSSGREAPQGYH